MRVKKEEKGDKSGRKEDIILRQKKGQKKTKENEINWRQFRLEIQNESKYKTKERMLVRRISRNNLTDSESN